MHAVHTRRPLPGGAYPLELASHLEEHLRWMRRCGRSEDTIYARRRAVVICAEILGMDPLHATTEDLERWQDVLLDQSGMTHMRLMTALIRPYFDYIHRKGYRADNPSRLIPLPPPPFRLPRPMPEDRVEKMLSGNCSPRIRCWLLIAGWMGLRAKEIASMKREHFWIGDEGQRWLTVIGKGNRQRNVAVPDWLYDYLDQFMAPEGFCWRRERTKIADGPVTAQHVSQYTAEYLHRVGIPDTLHSLRHRIATQVMERSGGDLRLVQQLLGHKSIESTALYTLVSPTRVANALQMLPGPKSLDGRHLRLVRDDGGVGST